MALSSAVAALLKPQADRGRNSFPLDNKQVYSMKAGQITPVKALHFMPGDFFKMKVADFALTFPMQTAPFLRGRKEFSFYSVYYNAIWSLFNQAQATRQDPKTSAFGDVPVFTEPRIGLSQLYFACFEQFVYYIYDKYTFVGDTPMIKTLHHNWLRTIKQEFLNVDGTHHFNASTDEDFSQLLQADTINTNVDYYHRQEDDIVNEEYIFDVVGQYRVYNWVRKLDMLGYGNIYPLLNTCERNIIDAELDYTRTNGSLSDATIHSLWELFTPLWNSLYEASVNSSTKVSKKVNVYSICAYNSIFYHFFRNSYYDNGYNPRNYSLDFASVQGGNNTLYMADFPLRFLDIEYHQWKKDMFTGVLPDTQYGAVSSVTIGGSASLTGSTENDLNKWSRFNGSDWQYNLGVKTNSAGPHNLTDENYLSLVHTHDFNASATLNNSSFDVIALKRAEMLQDYRQQLMRAGNKTSDVFRAIYGGSPSSEHEDDIIPRFLDTFGIDIFVDPVTATADTNTGSNGNLGDIAARGKFRGESKEIKFNAGNNFGVILALCYVVPTAEYNSYMLDKHNLELTPEDHFIPQFENLGLEPIYTDELNSLLPANQMAVLGYAPRYHHKKCQVDQVHGAFCSRYSNSQLFSGGRRYEFKWYGDFNHWVSPRTDMQSRYNTHVRDFYINPNVLDNVFVQAAGADLSQDQFICNTYFQIMSTRAMSKVGLINFV